MPNPISYIVSGSGTINAFANGRQYVIPRSHKNYDKAKAALATNDADVFVRAVDYQERLQTFVPTGRKVEIRGNAVYLDGVALHNVVTDRILALQADGFPWGPVGSFLENIQQNPSYRAIQELYKFLEHRALPITDNGHFLAYKRVRANWTDDFSGTFDNSVGKTVSVPRNTVNDDAREGCSNGLHVGSIEYVKGFTGQKGDLGDSSSHVIICRVNPRDVVSVPFDSNCTKLRCCEYTVIGEYTGDLEGLVYTSQGNAVPPPSRNDPAQAVTLAPPPREEGDWSGVDPGAPEGDKTVVNVADFEGNVTQCVPGYGLPNELPPFDFAADDVGLGPKIPMDEANDEEDDELVLADHPDDDDDDWEDDDSGLDIDGSDLDSELYPHADMDEAAELPQAEDVTTDEPAIDTASYAHPYNFNAEYGGES